MIDNGIKHTSPQESLDEKAKTVEMLSVLIVKGEQRYTKKDILHILRQVNKEAFNVEKKNQIDVEGLKF